MERKITMASIDIGAHSARMLIADVNIKTGAFEILEDLERSVPLGSNVFRDGVVSNQAIGLLCEILRNFRVKMDEYAVELYKAIATSAVREAMNSDIFLERVRHETGINLVLFEGSDTARLDYLSASCDLPSKMGFRKKKMMIADIGTGACQITAFECGQIAFTETIRVGTLRVLELMPETLSTSAMMEYLAPQIRRSFGDLEYLPYDLNSDSIVAMGASVRALVSLSGIKKSSASVISISRQQFQNIFNIATKKTVEEITDKYGISHDMAEIMPPCCLIIESLFKLTSASTLIIPMTSTKILLLRDFINETMGLGDYFEAQTFQLIHKLAEKYRCWNDNTKNVLAFSEKLFEKLSALHGLGQGELKILRTAACLHRSGLFVNNQAYHKHSFYLLQNMEIPGLSEKEHRLSSVVVRYHRKSMPRTSHPEYMLLSTEERSLVNKLASILRIACGLAAHTDSDRKLFVKINDEEVILKIEDGEDILSGVRVSSDTSYFNHTYARKLLFT